MVWFHGYIVSVSEVSNDLTNDQLYVIRQGVRKDRESGSEKPFICGPLFNVNVDPC